MGRVPELDALRGIAAVVILFYHLRYLKHGAMMATAVDLFFVLSGYLITTVILRSRGDPRFFRNFYARRGLRILPIYYLTFPVYFLIRPILDDPPSLAGLPYFLTYTQFLPRYWSAEQPLFSRHFAHTWTLAIEEQFYLFWPLAVMRVGRRFLPLLILPMVVAPVALRALGWPENLLLTRCDGLALGALLALMFLDREEVDRRRKSYRVGFATVAAVALSYPLWGRWAWPIIMATWPDRPYPIYTHVALYSSMTALFFGVVGLVLCDAGRPWLAWLRHPWLCHLGLISYGLYLYHPMIFMLTNILRRALGLRGSLWIDLIRAGICYAVASLSWKYFEKPILGLKGRFAYASRPARPALGQGPRRIAAESRLAEDAPAR